MRVRPSQSRVWVGMGLGALVLAVFVWFYVRGERIPPPVPPSELDREIAKMAAGTAEIDSATELMQVGVVAAGLTAEEGLSPGPFRLAFLPRLDLLEKLHHLAHGPFTGIRRMYCDIWINSISTYGLREATFGFGPVEVRPSFKLPVFVFLLDRLGRQKSAFEEYVGAAFEAIRGMDVHRIDGRARIWLRLMAACTRHPSLVPFIVEQLDKADRDWTDPAESILWATLEKDPSPARLIGLGGRDRASVRWGDLTTRTVDGAGLLPGAGPARSFLRILRAVAKPGPAGP